MVKEEKPLGTTILSLTSGILFLFDALMLRVPLPWSWMMISSVLTILASFFMYAYPRNQKFCGVLTIIFSSVSFLAILASAPWGHVIIWHRDGEVVFYQPDLSLHIFSGIPPLILGVGGGAAAFLHKFFKSQIRTTPKTFLKKCVRCGKEIPLASEDRPYCQANQSRGMEPNI